MFDFNPFEVGNPMTLGMLEEIGYSNFVNCDDDDDIYYGQHFDGEEWDDDDADDFLATW